MSPSRSFLVAARLLLLLVAGGAALTAVVIAGRDGARNDPEARYVCPMHAEVRAREPGACPICGMALEPTAPLRGRHGPGATDVAAVENVRRHNIVDFVRKRTLLVNERELRGPAWVGSDGVITAIFYDDQIDALAADEWGTFSLTQAPENAFRARRIAGSPVRWDGSTALIRFRPERALRPGRIGWLELAPRPRQVLTVPASALLQSPEGPYVLAWVRGFEFEKRPIEIGETFQKEGFAVVLSGLRVNERVVARAAFFLDADRRASGS